MSNSYGTYTDEQILTCLLTKNFSSIGRVFEDDVITKVKPGAFYEAQNLDRVTLTHVTEVGSVAFKNTDLTTLDLSWGSLTSIGLEAFADMDCDVLPASLSLTSVTTMQAGAFAQKNTAPNEKVTSVSLPLWTGVASGGDAYISSSIRGVFENWTTLTTITAPELTELPYYCFRRCSGLVNVNFPKVATYSTAPFIQCSSLKKVKLGGDVRTLMQFPFTGCNVIEAFILPGITTIPTITYNNWNSSRFATGDAYFYVPSSLVSSFAVATGWSNLSGYIRAIEDYPSVVSW